MRGRTREDEATAEFLEWYCARHPRIDPEKGLICNHPPEEECYPERGKERKTESCASPSE